MQQKQRVFAPKCNKVINEEVEKLLEAYFIREVFYPNWLKRGYGKEEQWQVEDVRRLHGLE